MPERDNALYFNDVSVGDSWHSQGRTITETDVVNFACLTGDFNPLHIDHEHARNTPFGRPVAHGLLGMSLVAGLGSHAPEMHTVAFTKVVDWQFLKPLYIGDTVHVETEVIELQPHGRQRGRITWRRRLVNQKGEVIQEGSTETLVSVSPEHRLIPR